MNLIPRRELLLALLVVAATQPSFPARGDVDISGDFTPDPPVADEDFRLFSGTLDIDGGSSLETGSAFVADRAGDSASAMISGDTSLWDVGGNLWVGAQGQGDMNIVNGGEVAFDRVGRVSRNGVDGMISVDALGSTLSGGRYLVVGDLNAGTLAAADGGQLRTAGANIGQQSNGDGTATLAGGITVWESSTYLAVGYRGTGTLNVTDGARMSNRHGIIGFGDGSNGTINVLGVGSSWQNSGRIDVGLDGVGTLNIRQQGSVATDDEMKIADGSVVEIQGAGSQLNVTRAVSSAGTIRLENGGSAVSDGLVIAEQSGSGGSLFIDGSTSSWTSTSFFELGFAGSASALLIDGARLSNTYAVLGREEGGGGTFNAIGEGTQWNSTGNLEIGRRGTGNVRIAEGADALVGENLFVASGSQLIVTGVGSELAVDSRTFNSGQFTVESGGTARLDGGIANAGIDGGGDVFIEGLIEPGVDAGIMEFDAEVFFGGESFFVFELGGLSAGAHDQILLSSGSIALDGELVVQAIDDFALEVGQEFTIFDVQEGADLFGSFMDLNEGDELNALGGGTLSISYFGGDGNDVVLTVVEGGGGSGAGSQAVPEPATLGLLWCAVMAALALRSRPRSRS